VRDGRSSMKRWEHPNYIPDRFSRSCNKAAAEWKEDARWKRASDWLTKVQIGNPGLQNATNFISRLSGASNIIKSNRKVQRQRQVTLDN